MKIQLSKPAHPLFLALAALLVLGLPLSSFAEMTGPAEVGMQAEEKGQEVDVLSILAEINSPSSAAVSKREKGGEPHARFGYEQALNKGNAYNTRHKIFQYMPDSSTLGTESMLAELSQEVAGKIYYELKEEGHNNLGAKVAVVAAVPLSDLKRESEFGRIIAEYYLTDLADRGIQVTELRMGSDINILPQTGEFLLSRNIGEIANNTPTLDYVVVSTFTNTRKTLILQGRLISLKTGLVKTSWRYNLPLNRELLSLFYSTDQQPFTIAVKGIGH